MNSIHGIIHDLADEETVIGGCTTASEVIITMQSLVEQNNSLKVKLEKIEKIIKSRDGFYLYDNFPPFQQIKEILEQE